MNTINYAQRLRKVSLFLNISQRELSSHIGISANSIVSPRVRKWVNRKYQLSRKVIKSAKDHSVCAFMPQKFYSIADNDNIFHRLSLNPCIHDFNFNYIFQYFATQGIHHHFKEIHGGWSRTYTNSQLINKRIQEVPYFAMAG